MTTPAPFPIPAGIGGPVGGASPPSWAQTTKNPWTPNNSSYNDTAATKGNTRNGVGNAVDGLAQLHLAFIGASLDLGYNGVGLTQDSTKSWPIQFRNELAALLGGVAQFDGIVPATGQDDLWAVTGGADRTTVPAYIWFNGAGTATRVTTPGTSVTVWFPNSNNATLTWTIDGVAQPNLVPVGGNTMNSVTVGGLGNTAHTVVVTSAGGSCFLAGLRCFGATAGITTHVLSLGGSSASFGTDYTNWSAHTNALTLSDSRIGMLTAAGITPHCVFIDLGGNDALHNNTSQQLSTALDDIAGRFPNSDLVFVNTWNVTPIGAARYAPYQAVQYAQADKRGARVFDICDVIGGLNNGIAKGWVGPDNIHPTYPTQSVFGRLNALTYVA